MVRKLKDKDGHKFARLMLHTGSAEHMRDSVVRCIIKIGAFILFGYFIM
jgi:hypothetical protein